MQAHTTDTLKTSRALKSAGFKDMQADALAEEFERTGSEIEQRITASMKKAVEQAVAVGIARSVVDLQRFVLTAVAVMGAFLALLMTAYRFFG
jgi:hypothetical protein